MEASDPEGDYQLLRGRRAVKERLDAMLESVREEILLFSANPWTPVSLLKYEAEWRRVFERAREGVRVRGLLHTTSGSRWVLGGAAPIASVELRHLGPEAGYPYVLVDDREVLLWVVVDPSTEDDATDDAVVWSDACRMVDTQREMFDALWAAGVPLERAEEAGGGSSRRSGGAGATGP